jgi:uncharacterized DUF497 family protein
VDLEIKIEFNPSAFKHGYVVADVYKSFETYFYDGDIVPDEEDSENKYLLIGLDTKANLIEIMYNVIDENTINVFHVMKCRKIYLDLIEL